MSELPKYARNRTELARYLDVDRNTIAAWIKLSESPKRKSDGRYVTTDWLTFKANRRCQNETPSDSVELKIKKLRQEIELNDIKILREAGDLVPLEWAKNLVAHLAATTCGIFRDSGLDEGDKLSLIEKIEAINFENYLSQLRAQIAADVAGESGHAQNGVGEGPAPGQSQLVGMGEAQA